MNPGIASPVADPAIDRRNGNIFILTQLLTYFSAPVLYVGVVQAAFCDKLGASAMVANRPSSTYLLGAVVPLFCAWLFPARLEQRIVQTGYAVVAVPLLLVCAVVFFPAPNWLRIAVVIGQGLMLGVLNSIINIYLLKCLARGTTETGRARALKYAFGFGPVAAVLGSLFAQLLLAGKIDGIGYPANFGVLYLVALPCMGVCALLVRRFRLAGCARRGRAVVFDLHPPQRGHLLRGPPAQHRLAVCVVGLRLPRRLRLHGSGRARRGVLHQLRHLHLEPRAYDPQPRASLAGRPGEQLRPGGPPRRLESVAGRFAQGWTPNCSSSHAASRA